MRGRYPRPLDEGSIGENWTALGGVVLYAPRSPPQLRNYILPEFENPPLSTPTVIPRSAHCISRANISKNALKVLYSLTEAGFEAYLVGGSVRDLLLGRRPKDFDVATSAHPEQVRALFRNCRLIGRRFRLAHVFFGRETIEVATFRARAELEDDALHLSADGRILRDNVYGTLAEDVWRRDFSVNSLYYDIRDFSVVDFTGAMADMELRQLRLVGDPETRYQEDPVRILRAIRFAAKLGFAIEPATLAPIREYAQRLKDIPPARLYEEVLKLFLGGVALSTFDMLEEFGVFGCLFPATAARFSDQQSTRALPLVRQALTNTDVRLSAAKGVTPGFLFAALLWPPVARQTQIYQDDGMGEIQAIEEAGQDVVAEQARSVSLPRRFSMVAREIWAMQPRLIQRRGKRALSLLDQPRFRAAYDFLELRASIGEPLQADVDWWTRFQVADGNDRSEMLQRSPRPKRRRARRSKPAVGP